jgi:hypothetical protein
VSRETITSNSETHLGPELVDTVVSEGEVVVVVSGLEVTVDEGNGDHWKESDGLAPRDHQGGDRSGRTELDAVVTVGEVGEGARLVDDTDLRGENNQNLRDASSDTILTAASWVLMMTDLMSSEVLPASARRWWRMMAASTAVCESAQSNVSGRTS